MLFRSPAAPPATLFCDFAVVPAFPFSMPLDLYDNTICCSRGLRPALRPVTRCSELRPLAAGSSTNSRPLGGAVRRFHASRPAEKRDFYDVLGVPRGADKSEVRAFVCVYNMCVCVLILSKGRRKKNLSEAPALVMVC